MNGRIPHETFLPFSLSLKAIFIDRDVETLSVLLHPQGRTQQTTLCQPTLLHTQSLKTQPTFIAESVLLLPNPCFFALKGPASKQLKRASLGSAWSSSPVCCMVLLPISICPASRGSRTVLGGGLLAGCSTSTSSGWQLEGRGLGGGQH